MPLVIVGIITISFMGYYNKSITGNAFVLPYQAYEKGVSRLHASIKINVDPVTVTDLGSVNGTRLNGQRISSNKAMPLTHGDIITLGKFKLQLIVRR